MECICLRTGLAGEYIAPCYSVYQASAQSDAFPHQMEVSMLFKDKARAVRAMKAAAKAGVDPRNSADQFGKRYARAWNDYNRRRSEVWANRELARHGPR
jgi:hypothetical protein